MGPARVGVSTRSTALQLYRVKGQGCSVRCCTAVNRGKAARTSSCSHTVSVCVCRPEGQPDPDPCGEGDPGGVGPVPVAVRPVHALHPGGAGRFRDVLLRPPALAPAHEGEAGQLRD